MIGEGKVFINSEQYFWYCFVAIMFVSGDIKRTCKLGIFSTNWHMLVNCQSKTCVLSKKILFSSIRKT